MSKNNTVFIGKNKNFWDRNRRSEGYLLKREIKQKCISVARALLLFGLCFMIIQPILVRFSTGFMEEQDLYDSTIVLVPRHLTLENYQHVFNLTDFPHSMLNTLWISILYSSPYVPLMVSRIAQCAVLGPVQFITVKVMCRFLQRYQKKFS